MLAALKGKENNMKFYKCHSAKFKNEKVMAITEQFNEIGPDAFNQTSFEIITMTDKMETIRNYAFSKLSNCWIVLPKSITEIEPMAFEGMGEGNVFFCKKGSEAYKTCTLYDLNVDEDFEKITQRMNNIKKADEIIHSEQKNVPHAAKNVADMRNIPEILDDNRLMA